MQHIINFSLYQTGSLRLIESYFKILAGSFTCSRYYTFILINIKGVGSQPALPSLMMGKRCVNNNKDWPCSTACAILADIASNRAAAVTTACFSSLIDRLLKWTECREKITSETKPCGYWLLEYVQDMSWYRALTLPHFKELNEHFGDSTHT